MFAFPIYVIEDDELARRLLEERLLELGRDVQTFEHATAFIRNLGNLYPGVIILDLNMPGMSGLNLLDEVGEDAPPFVVIVHSASRDVNDAIGAFRRGAIDFLTKPCTTEELKNVLRDADARLQSLLEQMDRQSIAGMVRLTKRELEVLRELASGKQSKVIAFELGISARTVEMHRSNLLTKLNAHGMSHAITIAKELGLI